MDLTRVAILDNEIQAHKLGVRLTENEIPHTIHTYHDSALDGLFQSQKGWGCVEAPESHKEEILRILEELPVELEEEEEIDPNVYDQ